MKFDITVRFGEPEAPSPEIKKLQEVILAAIDDLKTAINNVNTSVSNEIAAVSAKLASLGGGISDADAEALVTQLNTIKTNLDNETATLTGTTPPPVGP